MAHDIFFTNILFILCFFRTFLSLWQCSLQSLLVFAFGLGIGFGLSSFLLRIVFEEKKQEHYSMIPNDPHGHLPDDSDSQVLQGQMNFNADHGHYAGTFFVL